MIINVRVRPSSLKDEVIKLEDGKYKVNVREPAEDGRANAKVINLLAKEFNVSFRQIRIKNPKSRDKSIEITEL